jgi:hypothetical protein
MLEVSVAAGDPGPVIVLAGEAGRSSVTQLNEVLTAQVSARTRCLTIDATHLRSIDQATGTGTHTGRAGRHGPRRAVLVNPREPVLQVLDRSRVTEMFTVQDRAPAQTAPEGSMDGGFSERAM